MMKKQLHSSRSAEASEADDLKRIDGVGPAVENRLHRAGIFTFAALAALSPADIAAATIDLPGLSTSRIIKQDWIGQARRLASSPAPADEATEGKAEQIELASDVEEPGEEPEDEATGESAEQVVLVSGVEEPDEAPADEATEGNAEQVELALGVEEPEGAPQREDQNIEGEAEAMGAADLPVEARDATQMQPPESPSPSLQMSKVWIVAGEMHTRQRLFSANEPYDVAFTLLLLQPENTVSPGKYGYTAWVYCTDSEQGLRRTLGTLCAFVEPGEEVTVSLRGAALPPGVYWLSAETHVSLPPPIAATTGELVLKAASRRYVFEVY